MTRSYLGKSDNNGSGRASFKADLIEYGNEAQRKNMIRDFTGVEDVNVYAGNDIESVRADWYVRPVDSMEKLFLTVVIPA